MFKGSIAALITPFRNGAGDEDAFRAFVDWQVGEGTAALVPCGTTGESPTLSPDEHMRVVEICVEAAPRRGPRGGGLPRIGGVKDATQDLARPMLTRLAIGPEFCQLSGEDITVVPFLAQGGHGCISVTANGAPRLCALVDAAPRRHAP